MMAVLVSAACSDPSQPLGPPASIALVTAATVTVPAGGVFPVRVSVSDARERAVPDAAVVFQLMRMDSPDRPAPVGQANIVRTDANGVATIDAEVGRFSGDHELVITLADAPQVESAIVNVSVTHDSVARLEFPRKKFWARLGEAVELTALGFDRFENRVSGDFDFRALTPGIVEVTAVTGGRATITGLAFGTGVIVAERDGVTDTATVGVHPGEVRGAALGEQHTCQLFDDGKVYCWGAAPAAGAPTDSCGGSPCVRKPQLVASTVRFDTIAAGGDQTCGLSESALYCWGRGAALPSGESTTPQRVPGNISFAGASIAVGRDHACAVTVDGTAYCWGDNSRGQLGTGDQIAATTPTAVLSTERFQFLRAVAQYTCGVTLEGKVLCWGANSAGQLGRGTVTESEPVPVVVVITIPRNPIDLGPVSSLAAGEAHVCAWSSTWDAACWGNNDTGQFGDSTVPSSSTPRTVRRAGHVLAATAMGTCTWNGRTTWCSGSIGGFQYNHELMYYRGFDLTAGGQHACAAIEQPSGGGWYCWGDNSLGALGDGTLNSSRMPVGVVY